MAFLSIASRAHSAKALRQTILPGRNGSRVLGTVAEILGRYILLVAGTRILHQAWRFRRWKLWMRIERGLWMLSYGLESELVASGTKLFIKVRNGEARPANA